MDLSKLQRLERTTLKNVARSISKSWCSLIEYHDPFYLDNGCVIDTNTALKVEEKKQSRKAGTAKDT